MPSLESGSSGVSPGVATPRRLRIFISSPSDLTEERIVCEEVIRELIPEFLHQAVLEPILWEELPLTAERAFQDQIPLPGECEIVILMLWSRLGSRLHSRFAEQGEGEAPTGTLFEFRSALDARRSRQLPDLFRGEELLVGLARAILMPDALPELVNASAGDLYKTASEFAKSWESNPALAAAKIEVGLTEVAVEARRDEQRKLTDRIALLERVGDYRQAAELRSQAERILKPIARLVLVIDQFEEIFTTAGITDRERQLFIEVLDALARSSLVWIIATLRSDFLSRLAELPLLVRLIEGGGEYHLLAPTREELGQMIRLPAFYAGLQFEERAKTHATLDELLRDEALDDPLAMPLLEFALEELFIRRRPISNGGGLLTISAYAEIHKLRGAIGRQAEATFNSLQPSEQAAFTHVMRGVATLSLGESGETALGRRWSRYGSLTSVPGAAAFVDRPSRKHLALGFLYKPRYSRHFDLFR